jgi:hypothetical protein
MVFRGLFLLAFDEEHQFCQAAIMEAERHCLKVKIRTQKGSPSNSSELSFEIPDGDIFFEVTNRAPAVGTYEPGNFERTASHDRRDFRWLLDFEGDDLHHRQLPLRAESFNRSIFVRNGLFYTHATESVRIHDPLSAFKDADIAETVGCEIYLDSQQDAVLKYGPRGCYAVTLRNEPDVSYEIWLENLCEELPPMMSDFTFYYNVIDVPAEGQFSLSRPSLSEGPVMQATHRNPCPLTRLGTTCAPLIR